MSSTGRRELFTRFLGKSQDKSAVLRPRPPYAVGDESVFLSHCVECEAPCVDVCEERILQLDNDLIPVLDLSERGCVFCRQCAQACAPGVLDAEKGKALIRARIRLNEHACISWQKVNCMSCLDACDMRAISLMGVFGPEIDQDACTRCGMCIGRCPVEAITIFREMHA